jgi:hypothetical protein
MIPTSTATPPTTPPAIAPTFVLDGGSGWLGRVLAVDEEPGTDLVAARGYAV